jgi:hypothetical protein
MMRRDRRGSWGAALGVSVLLLLSAALAPAHAQTLSTADLAGTWSVFQLATPAANVTAPGVRSYSGTLTFDATGAVTSGILNDPPIVYGVTGTLSLTAAGLLDGTLVLDDGGGTTGELDVREGRLLLDKHTIVGASTVLGDPGLFTLVKVVAGQTFTPNDDLAGDWTYHEITPSNLLTPGTPGDATWVRGDITFHEDNGCTEADLMLADGTVRAARDGNPQSFG